MRVGPTGFLAAAVSAALWLLLAALVIALLVPGAARAGGSGSVFIEQVGEAGWARAEQRASDSRIEIGQNGDHNHAEAVQSGGADLVAELVQEGDRNLAEARQSGFDSVTGIDQFGTRNRAYAAQAGAQGNHAYLLQMGDGNSMALSQEGAHHSAELVQAGDDNAMSASQSGQGARLYWSQTGSGLPDLGISQSGETALSIAQSWGVNEAGQRVMVVSGLPK